MEVSQYAVVSNGMVIDGFERESVVASLAALLKCPPQQATALLSGKRVALKKGLDEQKAQQIHRALRAIGLDVVIVGAQPPAVPVPASGPALALEPGPDAAASTPKAGGGLSLALEPGPAKEEAPAAAAIPAKTNMMCPNCRTFQPKADACAKCGESMVAAVPAKDDQADEEQDEETLLARDLATYVGDAFDDKYRMRFVELAQNGGRYALQWSWPAFFIPLPWMIYRKLYIPALLLLVINALLFKHFFVLLLIAVALGFGGVYLYYRKALYVVNAEQGRGDERRDALAAKGGTHGIGFVLLVTFGLGILYGLMVMRLHLPSAAEMEAQQKQYEQTIAQASDEQTAQQLLLVRSMVAIGLIASGYTPGDANLPQDNAELMAKLNLKPALLQDRWDNEILYTPEAEGFSLRSAGPDGEMDTEDDVVIEYVMKKP